MTTTSAPPALRLGEIVLATGRYDALTAWYRQLLDLDPSLEHVMARAVEPAGEPASGPAVEHAGEAGALPGGLPTRMCFFRLHTAHPYQDVVAIFEVLGTRDAPSGGSPGLHHMQLRSASLPDLRARYRRLHAQGVLPYRSMDHGPSTSLYYRDPDANVVEIAACNFDSDAEMQACLQSDRYHRNPAGRAIDPQSLLEG